MSVIEDRRTRERDFWSTDQHEKPGAQSLENFINKVSEARVFVEKLDLYESMFVGADTIMELGGGQLWASALVKRKFPHAKVIGTDLSEEAIASRDIWERVYGSTIDSAIACLAESIPVDDNSVDLAFAFSAAHHFGRFRTTMTELARILSKGGSAILLHEPVCPRYIYPAAHARVNAKRPAVPEDVIVYRKLEAIGKDLGLEVKTNFVPTQTDRRGASALYYFGLGKLPWLQFVLPTSADIVITKR